MDAKNFTLNLFFFWIMSATKKPPLDAYVYAMILVVELENSSKIHTRKQRKKKKSIRALSCILEVVGRINNDWQKIHPVENPEDMRKIYGWQYDQGGRIYEAV